jgi:hypothetical protein
MPSIMKRFLVAHYNLHEGLLVQEFVLGASPYNALVNYICPQDRDEFCQRYPTLESIQCEYAVECDQWFSVADLQTNDIYN